MPKTLYRTYQTARMMRAAPRANAAAALQVLEDWPEMFRPTRWAKHAIAANRVYLGAELTHKRPPFGSLVREIDSPVEEVVVDSTPFADLLHFRRADGVARPPVLIAAPLSGHFATLLTPTVRAMLIDHDVYITDWHNARDVPRDRGRFGLDEYVDQLIRFLKKMGPGVHLLAVCQPCPPAVMAAAALAERRDPAQPRTLTLMSGPIDTRANPTRINKVAYRQPRAAYLASLSRVPRPFAGVGRKVYPGFVQLGSFMSLDPGRHVAAQREIYRHIVKGEEEDARRMQEFYAEYFAVLDMPAEFYMETIDRVFKKDLLARGEMTYHGHPVRPEIIENTALLTIEAERDEMCAPGQTEAAHRLFTGIPESMHRHHLQAGVGHYGVFAGRRWADEVYPLLRDFIAEHDTERVAGK